MKDVRPIHAGQPRASSTLGRFNWLMPMRMPSRSQARRSRGRTATTQKPSRIDSQGSRNQVMEAKNQKKYEVPRKMGRIGT
jgi:hypothetical protein